MSALEPRMAWSSVAPLPVVVDADFLSRSVDHALVHGYQPSVVRHASGHYTSFSGVVVFVTDAVFDETVERFEEIALARSVSVEEVMRVWDNVFAPQVRVVDMTGVLVRDARVDEVARLDPDDAPTAALAVLLGPSFLLTDNRAHFRAFGLPDKHPVRIEVDVTTAFSLDIRDWGAFMGQLNAGTLPVRAAGLAAYEGGKRLVQWVGRDAAVILVLVMLGGLALYWSTPRGKQLRSGVTDAVRRVAAEYGDDIAVALERAGRSAIESPPTPSLPAKKRRSVSLRDDLLESRP